VFGKRKNENQMSKFFCLCRANNKKHGLNDQPIKFKKTRKIYNFNFYISAILLCLIVLASGFYLLQITASSTSGFKVSEYEQDIFELKLANQDLRERVNTFENLDYIKDKANQLGLAVVENVEYLDVDSKGVVMK